MKIYGQLLKAQLENTAADLADTIKGLMWFNTTTDVAKFYDGTAVRTVVDTNSTQAITGKIISGSEITPKVDTYANLVTYATTSGDGKLVFASDNKLFYFTSNNILNEVAVMKTINGTITSARLTVGTSAVRATVAGTAPDANRKRLMITPASDNTGKVYLGSSSVTVANGKEIVGPDTLPLDWDASDYYLISDTAAQVVAIVEVV
jgi:hypothetical protein